jgi:hypothetical protein
MPKFLEEKLKREYGEKSAVPYKVMNKMGVMRGNKITAKGREMERKHEADMKKDHGIRELRIEVHRKGNKITGHTVHHHMVPKPTGKSHAFYEDTHHSFPFSADDHKGMMAHVNNALNGSEAKAAANAEADEVEDDE